MVVVPLLEEKDFAWRGEVLEDCLYSIKSGTIPDVQVLKFGGATVFFTKRHNTILIPEDCSFKYYYCC